MAAKENLGTTTSELSATSISTQAGEQGAKHTPGPWKIIHTSDFLQIAAEGVVICDMGLAPAADWPENEAAGTIANARLIAAAPTMLTSLELIELLTKDTAPAINGLARECIRKATQS